MVFWEHREAECDTHSFAGGSGEVVSSEESGITVSDSSSAVFLSSVASAGQSDCVYVPRVHLFAELLSGVTWIS